MKPGKWRDLSADEIDQKVRELGEEIFNLRFQLSMGVAKNPSRLRDARRDLARAKTIQGERAQAGTPTGRATAPARAAAPAKRAKKG